MISSISLLKKTSIQLSPYTPKSLRSKGSRKFRKRAFFIFRQFPNLGTADKKELLRILNSKPAVLRLMADEDGFPKSVTKKCSFLPLTMSAVVTNYLFARGFLPQSTPTPSFQLQIEPKLAVSQQESVLITEEDFCYV